ncbi:type II toxin-antitoxin system mRNA interferase toxin, RelE/StbE family [Candidatus Kaiserbacteria bacterium]|nr:type II toxin-antitoxin system mRNA interferase toxin, RelE/StbE family [Candidatus Kaiserbacteria bacterium]
MTRVVFHRNFKKRTKRLPRKIQEAFKKRRDLFLENPFHPILDNHSVERAYPGWRSINITGDYRVLFEEQGDSIQFMTIGTHSELYG